jgi:hypothetical protein
MATQTGPLLDALGPDLFAAQVAEESFVDATPHRGEGAGHRTSHRHRLAIGQE